MKSVTSRVWQFSKRTFEIVHQSELNNHDFLGMPGIPLAPAFCLS